MTIQPYILAIDSATSTLRVGLSLPAGEVDTAENNDRFRHAEFIFGLIDQLIKKNKIEKSQLTGIVVSTGPGSFTGLRVGMASVKALAIALNIPLVGISAFAAITGRLYQQFGATSVLIPSRRDEYYYAKIDSPQFDNKNIQVLKTADIESLPDKGNLLPIDFDLYKLQLTGFKIIDPKKFAPTINDLILSGQKTLTASGGQDIARLEPLYIQMFPAKPQK
jgi:tRNA threonylcarbamoyl adenosine modification protein YeaZ